MSTTSKEHRDTTAYPAEKARQGEIILRSGWQRAIFIAGLAGAVGLPLVMIGFAVTEESATSAWVWLLLVTLGVAILGFALAYGRAASPRSRDQMSRADERDTVVDVPGSTPKRKDSD